MRMALILAVALAACVEEPISTESTNNPDIPVQKLFEYDDCTVYRFWDDGRKYFVKCKSSASAQAMWSESHQCGKATCSRPASIVTATEGGK